MKPSLSLSYSSAATDGDGGKRISQQAGWVGQGWSLDMESIAGTVMANGQVYYSLAFNGQSYDLLRGNALIGTPDPTKPTDWDWRPTDESFIKVRAVTNGTSDPNTAGGYDINHVLIPRYRWQVWTKDGTRYDFADEAWWGFYGAISITSTARWRRRPTLRDRRSALAMTTWID